MGSKRSWRGEMDEGGIGLNHVKNLKILSSLLSLSSRSTCIPIPHFQISLFDSIFRVLTFPSNTGRLWWREWCGFFLPKIRIWMSIFFCSFSILHTLNMRMIGDSWTPLLVASPSCVQRCMQKGTQGSRNVRKMRKSYKVIGSECDQFNSALNEYGIRKPETSNWVLRTPPPPPASSLYGAAQAASESVTPKDTTESLCWCHCSRPWCSAVGPCKPSSRLTKRAFSNIKTEQRPAAAVTDHVNRVVDPGEGDGRDDVEPARADIPRRQASRSSLHCAAWILIIAPKHKSKR